MCGRSKSTSKPFSRDRDREIGIRIDKGVKGFTRRGMPRRPYQSDRACRRFHVINISFVRRSLIVSRSLAAFSNSNFFAASRI